MSTHSRSGIVAAMMVMVCWGLEPVLLKLVQEDNPLDSMVQYRLLGAALFVSLYAAASRRLRGAALKLLPLVFASGALLLMNYYWFIRGLSSLDPFRAVLLLQLGAVLYSVVGQCIWRSPLPAGARVTTAIAFGGYALLFAAMIAGEWHTHGAGVLAITGAALCWCLYAITLRILTTRLDAASASAYVLIAACLLSLPLLQLPAATGGFDLVLFLAVCMNGSAYLFLAFALERCRPVLLGPIVALNPLLTAAGSMLLLPGSAAASYFAGFSRWELLGAAAALIGTAAASAAAGRKEE